MTMKTLKFNDLQKAFIIKQVDEGAWKLLPQTISGPRPLCMNNGQRVAKFASLNCCGHVFLKGSCARCQVQLHRRKGGLNLGSGLRSDRLSEDDQGGQWQRVRIARHGPLGLSARRHARLLSAMKAH